MTAARPAASGGTLIIATDLPLQGASHDASTDTNNAISLLLEQAGGKAGNFTVELKTYDDSTAAKGGWDDATCAKNANDHVANKARSPSWAPTTPGCAKIEVPVLNQDPTGPMLMVSHANTNPGLTKAWDPGEPDKYYPTGVRNYGRIIATDDFQGQADAQFAKQGPQGHKCVVLNDAQTYGVGVATAFKTEAAKQGIEIVADEAWDAKQPNYTALFEGFKDKNPDCVFLGGINDNNGEQLIRDKVAVLGPNDGAVKLIGPDGFTGYPTVRSWPKPRHVHLLRRSAGVGADQGRWRRCQVRHRLQGQVRPRPGLGVRHLRCRCNAVHHGVDRRFRRNPQGCSRRSLLRQITIPPSSRSSARRSASTRKRRRDRAGHVDPAHEGQRRDVPQGLAAGLSQSLNVVPIH